jgi:hypothetical protein
VLVRRASSTSKRHACSRWSIGGRRGLAVVVEEGRQVVLPAAAACASKLHPRLALLARLDASIAIGCSRQWWLLPFT